MPKQTEGLIWDTPPSRGRGVDFSAIAAELRTRKGIWAVIATYPKAATSGSTAWQVNTGRSTAFTPAGSYEAAARTVDGEHRLYARYVGDGEEDGRSTPLAPGGA